MSMFTHGRVPVAIVALAAVGVPLFVLIGLATVVAWDTYYTQPDLLQLGAKVLAPIEELMGKDSFLAIPLFIATGAIMTDGGMARRLIEFMRALLGWMPGGLGIAAVMSCMFFASISGSSPVTLIAVGSIMYPAMVRSGYPDKFSLGLVMTAGSLGCLVAPSLILTVYALAVQGEATVEKMWEAAYIPAAALMGVLALYCFVVGLRTGERDQFSLERLGRAFLDGVWSLALPLIVLLGRLFGFFAPFQAGAVAFVYALLVTLLVHREMTIGKLLHTLSEAGRLMGMLILIIALTFSLNKLFVYTDLHTKLTEFLTDAELGPIGFLILVNVFLIVVGALMDSVSATILFAPILAPIAVHTYGIDPVHFGIVFVVNMEIGYLAPPVATNLFVATALFKKPFGHVARAVVPGLMITIAALFVFMFVPTFSKGLLNARERGSVWEPFPWDGERQVWMVDEGGQSQTTSEIMEEAAEQELGDEKVEAVNKQSAEDYYFGDGDDEAAPVELEGEDGGVGDAGVEDAGAGDDDDDDDQYAPPEGTQL